MNFPDVRTVMLCQVLTDAVCTAVLVNLWAKNRKRFDVRLYWVLDFAFQTAAAVLLLLRGSIPAWLSMGVSTPLVLAGAFLGYLGLAHFVGTRSRQAPNYVLLAVLVAVHLHFSFGVPNLAARNVNVSLGLLVMCFQCARLAIRRVSPGMRRMTLATGIVFGVFGMTSIVRIVVVLSNPWTGNDFLQSGVPDTLFLVIYQLLLVLLAFSLAMMINQRLSAELIIQEEKFATIFRSSPSILMLSRASDGRILEVNTSFESITGYSSRDAVGTTTPDLRLWVGEEDCRALSLVPTQSTRLVEKECQFRKHSGELWTGLLSAEIIMLNEEPLVLSSISDITERKKMEEALRDSEAQFRHVFETANVGKSITYLTGEIHVNKAFCDMLGYTKEELQNRKWQDLTPPDEIEMTQQALNPLLEGKQDSTRFTKTYVHRNGSRIAADVSTVMHRDREGTPLHFITTVVDITERRRSAEALERSEEKFRLLTEKAVVGIYIIQDGTMMYVNPSCAKTFGYSPDEICGVLSPKDLIHPDDIQAVMGRLQERLNGKVEQGVRSYKAIKKDGSLIHIEVYGMAVEYQDRPAVMGTLIDVTERRRLEDQLRQAQKMETVGQLAGGVAHDFNNMLQVISSNAELALSKIDAGQPQHKYLLEIRRAAQRSAEITGQLLAFARRQTVSPKVLDLNDAVARSQKMLQRLIGEDIELAWIPGHDLWKVEIDPSQLDQVLANLAVNARDAIGGVGRLTVETHNITLDEAYGATHAGVVPGEYLLLALSDDGCGMSKETLSHLFEPFFTTKEVRKGTGLGLATVYGIVKQNKGFINVYSEPGEGTTFRVYLPRAEGAEGDEGDEGEDVEAVVQRGGSETVLVVEDEEAILELARENLKELGYTVLSASSPEEALRMSAAHAGKIDLLVTDVVMPRMNGRQLAERIGGERAGLKVLYMSGYTADVIAHRGVLEQGVSLIAKPFSLTTLADKVREVLDGSGGDAASPS